MFRVRVCAALLGGFFGPKFPKQGSLFARFDINMGGFARNWRKIAKMGLFRPKFIIKVGMDSKFR